jgi:P27 family predicted phage terminase small subunit
MKPPKHLKRPGRKLFRQIQTEYGITDAGGISLLVRACECQDRLAAVWQIIAEEGEVTKDRYGNPRLHPAMTLEKDARAGFLQAMKQLNLDVEPLKPPGRSGQKF